LIPSLTPLVSVITPVYNGAEYLAECIESVLAQTYPNWDHTIVDNCSTDGSLEIARGYAQKDQRIRICENEKFLRVNANHNRAFRQISPDSKYCKVVFADDWIFPECLERMVGIAEECPSAGIVGAYVLEGQYVACAGLPYKSKLFSGREICRERFLRGLHVFGPANNVLFRADLVRSRDPFYNESNLHADIESCIALLRACDFGFVHQVLTFTRERPGSLTAMSKDMHTIMAGKLHDLVMYGRDFLSQEELEACLERDLSDYYATLVGGLVRFQGKRFWDYHKRKLTEAGVGFSRLRLARVALKKVCLALINPLGSIQKVRQVANEFGGTTRPAVSSKEMR